MEPKTFAELKAHYLAVKQRLGGVAGGTGVVPPNRVFRPKTEKDIEHALKHDQKFALKVNIPNDRFVRMLREVAVMHDMDPNVILEKSARDRNLVSIRHEVLWKAKNDLKMSYMELSRLLHRDHTSIMYMVKKHQKTLDNSVSVC